MITLSKVGVSGRLDAIDLVVNKAQHWHILGQNGAGKSTLLQIMSGLVLPQHGCYLLSGAPISDYSLAHLARFRAFHGQQQVHSFAIPAGQYIDFYGTGKGAHTLPAALTEALELKPLLSRPVTRLSGGEQQRVNLARALWQVWAAIEAGEALLVLDEPMQGLDIRHQLTFLTFLQQLCQQGNTTIISSHDLTLSARFASHAMLLNGGRHIASGDISQVFTPANLKMGYGIAFDISNNQNTLQIHPKWPPVLP